MGTKLGAVNFSPRQIRVINANKWFSYNRFPESKVIEGTKLHQRINFSVKINDSLEAELGKNVASLPKTDFALVKRPIFRGQLVTVEDFEKGFANPKEVFDYLVKNRFIHHSGIIDDAVYESEEYKKLNPTIKYVLDSAKRNAFFLNYDILIKSKIAENPIDFFGVIDKTLKKQFSMGQIEEQKKSLWTDKSRYSLLFYILSGEDIKMTPEQLISSVNHWFSGKKDYLYGCYDVGHSVYHNFEFVMDKNLSSPKLLSRNSETIRSTKTDMVLRAIHKLGIPVVYLSDPLKFLDSVKSLVFSIHAPLHAAGITGRFWDYSMQVDLFLDTLKDAEFGQPHII